MSARKSSLPIPTVKRGGGRKFVALVLLGLLLVAVVNDPTGSAHTVQAVWGWLSDAGAALVTFFRSLSK